MSLLMANVFWVFGRKKFASIDEFNAAVTDHNKKIAPTKSKWDPNQVVAPGPIQVVYEAPWKDEDDTIEVDIGEPGTAVTMSQVLFTLNNATFDFFHDVDKRFFEGLIKTGENVYALEVGS